jgi:GTP-binding protein
VDLVDHPSIYMVDLPGYGYARVHHSMKSAWEELAERYFHENRDLRLLMVLVDIRRDLESDEYLIIDLARKASIVPLLVATKADKLNFSSRQKRIREIARSSGIEPLPASSHSRLGMEEIWEQILKATG